MNPDQVSNIEKSIEEIAKTLSSAWRYYYLLQGFNEGGKGYPVVLDTFPWLFDEIWRAIFDGFFAKFGILLDTSRNTYSLPNLIKLVKRYGDSKSKKLAQEVENRLLKKDGINQKIRSWRHDVVAHKTAKGIDPSFYASNKMTLSELKQGLIDLEEELNIISRHNITTHNFIGSETNKLLMQGKLMFKTIADGISATKTLVEKSAF